VNRSGRLYGRSEPAVISVMLIVPDADAALAWYRHQLPWGTHRQGGFTDPFGHKWSVGDRSPLR